MLPANLAILVTVSIIEALVLSHANLELARD